MSLARVLFACAALSVAQAAAAQPASQRAPKAAPQRAPQLARLTFVRDTAFPLNKHLGMNRVALDALVGRDGRVVVVPEAYYGTTEAAAMDSSGKKLPWSLKIGRGEEIGYVDRFGWAGDSVWLNDRGFRQTVMLGRNGEIARSVEPPSWIRPFWRDRRRYPLFRAALWYGMYGDGSLLAMPSQPRRLLDTPQFDENSRLFVRVDRDGRILKTVATAPLMDGRITLRSGVERKTLTVPNYPRPFWAIADDGERLAVVVPEPRDSGAVRVTVVNADGDTIFARRLVIDAIRVPDEGVNAFIANLSAFGRYSAEQMRDTIRKLVPMYNSPLNGVDIGVDRTIWVGVRRPGIATDSTEWVVLDSLGEPVGSAFLLRTFRRTALSLDKIWSLEHNRPKSFSTLVRFKRAAATTVRPSRSAPVSAASAPVRRPE